jgi:hypothetical protein
MKNALLVWWIISVISMQMNFMRGIWKDCISLGSGPLPLDVNSPLDWHWHPIVYISLFSHSRPPNRIPIPPTQVTQIQNVVQQEPLTRETYRVTIQRKCVTGYFIARAAALGMKYPVIHDARQDARMPGPTRLARHSHRLLWNGRGNRRLVDLRTRAPSSLTVAMIGLRNYYRQAGIWPQLRSPAFDYFVGIGTHTARSLTLRAAHSFSTPHIQLRPSLQPLGSRYLDHEGQTRPKLLLANSSPCSSHLTAKLSLGLSFSPIHRH